MIKTREYENSWGSIFLLLLLYTIIGIVIGVSFGKNYIRVEAVNHGYGRIDNGKFYWINGSE